MASTALRLVPPSIPLRPSPVSNPPPPSPSPALSNPRWIPNLSTIAQSRSSSSVHGPLHELPDDPDLADLTFDCAVTLFNAGDYHRCHDYLEELWTAAEDPAVRTVLHGVLQCAVGFHHLFNRNHRGAMLEMGEGLCKLRKIGFARGGPLFRFEREVSEVLEFVYQTQMELAAWSLQLPKNHKIVEHPRLDLAKHLLNAFAHPSTSTVPWVCMDVQCANTLSSRYRVTYTSRRIRMEAGGTLE